MRFTTTTLNKPFIITEEEVFEYKLKGLYFEFGLNKPWADFAVETNSKIYEIKTFETNSIRKRTIVILFSDNCAKLIKADGHLIKIPENHPKLYLFYSVKGFIINVEFIVEGHWLSLF